MRKKYVFRPDEIPHLFVHQIQDQAWTSSQNLSFSGPNYKSYTTVIASRVINRKGEVAFLIDEYRHSVTTGRQIDGLLRAIPSGTKVMRVHRPFVDNGREWTENGWQDKKDGRTPDHHANLVYWTTEVDSKLRESARSREPKKSRLMGEASHVVDKMREYVAFFDLKRIKYPKLPATVGELAIMQAANVKRDALAKKKAAIANEKRHAELRLQYSTERAGWLEGTSNGTYWTSYYPLELRIVGDEIQTSHGASFPLTHAKRGLALVESVIARGEEWKRNGHTCHLGHYQIDRIEPNGTVHAGCHVVPFAAIARIRESIVLSIAVAEVSDNE